IAHTACKDAANTALVAANTGPDFGAPARFSFNDKHRVGNHSAYHIDEVCLIVLQSLLGIIERGITTYDDSRHGDTFGNTLAKWQLIAYRLIHSCISFDVKVIVAMADVYKINEFLSLSP